jgi:hypothetical protein
MPPVECPLSLPIARILPFRLRPNQDASRTAVFGSFAIPPQNCAPSGCSCCRTMTSAIQARGFHNRSVDCLESIFGTEQRPGRQSFTDELRNIALQCSAIVGTPTPCCSPIRGAHGGRTCGQSRACGRSRTAPRRPPPGPSPRQPWPWRWACDPCVGPQPRLWRFRPAGDSRSN